MGAARGGDAEHPVARREPRDAGAEGDDAPLGEEARAQWENFKEAQGMAAEELKGVWDQFRVELRDMPAKKPLTTALVAFMLGLSIGRMGRK
jgi:hypothetical protein